MFENEVSSAQRIKANFVSNLWTWANLYSVDNSRFPHMVGEYVGFLGLFSVCFCFGSLLFTTRVHLESFAIFIIFAFY